MNKHRPMRRILALILTVAMCLGMLPASFAMAAGEGTYTQVTDVSEITAGGQFVLIAAYTNAGVTSYYPLGTTIGSKITATAVTESVDTSTLPVWTIEACDTGVSLYNGTAYLSYGSSTNFSSSNTAAGWKVTEEGTDTFRFVFHSATRAIAYQYNNGNCRYGAYATSNAGQTGYTFDLMVFKVGTGSSEESNAVAKPAATPASGSVVAAGDTITVSCETQGATIYQIVGGSEVALENNTLTIPEGTKGEISFTLIAKKDGCEDSDEVTLVYTVPQPMTIAEAKAAAENTTGIVVNGTVVRVDGKNVVVQDSADGINLYFSTAPTGIAVGDTIEAMGKRSTYNGLVQLTAVSVYTKTGTVSALPAATVTIADLISDSAGSNTYESTRVYLENVVIGAINTSGNTTITGSTGESINIYKIPALTGIKEGDTVNLYAVVSDYNGYQLRVNDAEDVTLVSAGDVEENGTVFAQVTELTDGEAVLVVKYGDKYYALDTTISKKINAIEVTVADGIVSGSNLPVWTLSVGEGTAALFNGTAYLGYASSTNFATSNTAYDWTVAGSDGMFTFSNASNRGVAYQYNGGNFRFGAYAASNSTNSDYAFNFMVFQLSAATDTVPQKVDSVNHLDKVYIYYPAGQLVISDKASGSKLTGVAATVTDNQLAVEDGMVELVASVDKNGYYSFVTTDGKYLTSGATGNSLSFASEASQYSLWTLEKASDGFYIKNVNAAYSGKAQYIEYYNNFTTYGFSANNTSIYTFQFFKSGTASAVPGETPGGEEGGDTFGVADGEYVIWAPAFNMALSSVYNGYYNRGVVVTPSGDSVTGYAATEIWTVTNNEDGTISISFGGRKLGMAASYSSLTLGEVHDTWTLEDAGNGLYYVKNVGRSAYIEWYSTNSNWSGYGTIASGKEGLFALQFTPADRIYTVEDDIVESIAAWSGGYSEELTGKLYADGDKFISGDHLDENAKLTIVANGKEVCPYYLPGSNGYMGAENLGAKEGDYIQLALSTAGWADMELSFRMRATKTGPAQFQLQYSTNGGKSFRNFSTGSYSYAYTAYTSDGSYPVTGEGAITDGMAKTSLAATYYITFTFDVPAGAANCSELIIRMVPGTTEKANGTTGAVSGNIRIDSVVLSGSPIVDDSITGFVSVDPDGVEEDQAPGTELTMSSTTAGAVISYRFAGGEWKIYDAASKPVLPKALPAYLEVKASCTGKADSITRIFSYAAGTVESVVVKPNGGGVYIAEGSTVITLSCATEGATIYYATSADGKIFTEYAQYTQALVLNKGFGSFTVKAYAVKEGFNNSTEVTRIFTEMVNEKYNIYFGQLHSHTSISDGAGTITEAYQHAYNVYNLDFLAVTDHSNSFDGAAGGVLAEDASSISTEWKEAHAAAQAITDSTFVGLYGFEMTWSNGLGHINTFNTPGFQSRTQSEYTSYNTALQNYYEALKTVSGSLSQFNHPGTTFGDFSDFAHYDEEIDALITLIEVGNGEGAIGSGGYFPSYEYYTRALDKGWHVAPSNNQDNHKGNWGSSNTGRTVVLAAELTEQGIYDAIRNYRVYATEDNDLSVYYTLDGNIMGTILSAGDVGSTVTIKVDLSDPTDAVIGKVEVIVNGGLSIASTTVSSSEGTVTLTVPADYNYYYLRITQPDGDIAVTAPVWVGKIEAAGISALSSDNTIVVAQEEQSITLELFNNESKSMAISSITLTNKATGEVLATNTTIDKVGRYSTASCTFSCTFPVDGIVTVTATVVAVVGDMERTYTQDLELQVMPAEIVSNILIDGTHGNDYVTGYYGGNMGNMTAIAAANGVRVTVETEKITAEMLADCSLLIISAPARGSGTSNDFTYTASPFEDSFIELVAEYVKNGGSVVVCGLADYQDKKGASVENHAAYQLNKLLEAIGSTMRINDDEAYDEVNYSNQYYRLQLTNFNTDSVWTAGMVDGQTYSQYSGCTVSVGSGTWLVKGFDTTYSIDSDGDGIGGVAKGDAVFLACEDTAYGGTIFAAGGVFLSDFEVKAELDNIWDRPYANRTVYENMLSRLCVTENITDIADVRDAELGRIFAVEGYVTSGTTNANTSFFDAIYVQDATGGITVFPYSQSGLAIGTKVRIIGYTDAYQGDKEIQIINLTILDEPAHVYAPRELSTADASDYDTFGGQLVKTTGIVSNVIVSNGVVSQFDLTDNSGKSATVFIDGYITNEAGVNDIASWIKEGQTVSAVGLLYLHPEGDSDVSVPVLRVRNCDEIVLIAHAPTSPMLPTDPQPEDKPEDNKDQDAIGKLADVKPGTWYYKAVEHVVTNGYFKGVSENAFAPNDMMTRAMFVTVLGRVAGVAETADASPDFADVVPNSWYSGYVAWAAENGIVQGMGDGKFGQGENITREQMAVFLYRYAKYAGLDTTVDGEDALKAFADADKVSSWAKDAMRWAVSNGIINGTGNGLEPLALATRAQVAQIILNFAKHVG